jgi:hypothetical protein
MKNINRRKRYWSFFWHTRLSVARQTEIRNWIDSLTAEQYKMLEDITFDAKEDASYDAQQEDM